MNLVELLKTVPVIVQVRFMFRVCIRGGNTLVPIRLSTEAQKSMTVSVRATSMKVRNGSAIDPRSSRTGIAYSAFRVLN